MPNTIPMHNPENGTTADIHPDEVENMKAHGWRETVPPVVAPAAKSVDPPFVEVPPPPPAPPAEKPKLTLPKKD